MEAYLDVCLFTTINMVEMDWPEGIHIVTVSNWLTYVSFGFCAILPILMSIYLCVNRKKWHGELFMAKAGTMVEGTSQKAGKEIYVAMIPIVFFTRRLLSTVSLIFWIDFFFGQIVAQFILCMAVMIFLN